MCWRLCLMLSSLLAILVSAAPQESAKVPLLEVVLTTYDASRKETLIYLRVLPDGHAEAHPMRQVDFRSLTVKTAQLSPAELAALDEFLGSSEVQKLDSKYERYWGNVDFGQTWQITIARGNAQKSIVLENFQPFLARGKKKPYPAQLEKLGCLIWSLRTE